MKKNSQNLYFLNENRILTRRNVLKMGGFAIAGLGTSYLINKERKAEAVPAGLIRAALLGISVIPKIYDAWNSYVRGSVDTQNNSSRTAQGYVNVIVVDNNYNFNVQGWYGPYRIPPGHRMALPYNGLVPNGTGYKHIYARSYISQTNYYGFDWYY